MGLFEASSGLTNHPKGGQPNKTWRLEAYSQNLAYIATLPWQMFQHET